MTTLYYLRNDLRLHDNECLHRAAEQGHPLLCVYILDPRQYECLNLGFRKTGYLRFLFSKETLAALRRDLQALGSNLLLQVGQPEVLLPQLAERYQATRLYYQREATHEERAVERALHTALQGRPCTPCPIWGSTLYHIDDLPFDAKATPLTSKTFRKKLRGVAPRPCWPTPSALPPPPAVADWGRLPQGEALGFTAAEIDGAAHAQLWAKGGETHALARLEQYSFGTQQLTRYRWTRNGSLGREYSSQLSPWLALGSLSPRQVYWTVKRYEQTVKKNQSTWWLLFELGWRDYFRFSAIRHGNKLFLEGGIKEREVDWQYDEALFERWRTGQTGIPFVDAHMRQLQQTGFCSNRGRVNAASFLARDYQIDWRWGAAWFESQLLDYDVCSNWLNWNLQATEIWYTNPVHQGLKYDRSTEYIKTWLPELRGVEGPIAQAPWLLEEQGRALPAGYAPPVAVYKKWGRSLERIRQAQDGS